MCRRHRGRSGGETLAEGGRTAAGGGEAPTWPQALTIVSQKIRCASACSLKFRPPNQQRRQGAGALAGRNQCRERYGVTPARKPAATDKEIDLCWQEAGDSAHQAGVEEPPAPKPRRVLPCPNAFSHSGKSWGQQPRHKACVLPVGDRVFRAEAPPSPSVGRRGCSEGMDPCEENGAPCRYSA